MQRTTSTPTEPQVLSSWRPDLPEEATPDAGTSQGPQGFSQQPLPSSSPPVHAMPSRTPSFRTTGTEPVCSFLSVQLWHQTGMFLTLNAELSAHNKLEAP